MSFKLTPPTRSRAKKKRGTAEGRVVDQVSEYLEERGWCVVRFETGLFFGYYQFQKLKGEILDQVGWANPARLKGVVAELFSKVRPTRIGTSSLGSTGFPDLIAFRYTGDATSDDGMSAGLLLIECKRSGQKPTEEQTAMLDKIRRTYRARALWCDGLFDGKQPFDDYYRRKIEKT